jgi:hypothetical protein
LRAETINPGHAAGVSFRPPTTREWFNARDGAQSVDDHLWVFSRWLGTVVIICPAGCVCADRGLRISLELRHGLSGIFIEAARFFC